MKLFLTDLFDFFLPRICSACKTRLSSIENIICNNCLNSIQIAEKQRIEFEYNKKFERNNLISGFTSLYVFEKDKQLQEILHQFKYSNKYRIGIKLGEEIAKTRNITITDWKIDLVIPVPLHHLKKAERGYNQSYYIAKGFSQAIGIKKNENLLKRKRYTESQTLKNISDRELNVRDAFSVTNKTKIKGKNILLVDDVITTGATVSECARQLLNAGANKVYSLSAAIAD